MNPILRYLTIRAALRRARDNHATAFEAATEIKAARRKVATALLRARSRRLFAAWLDPRNPGWNRHPAKPANVLSIRDAQRTADIQFPRIPQILSSINLVQKGGAA